jgi:hypothetical protein
MKSLAVSGMALLLAVIAVALVNVPGPLLIETAFPGSLGPDQMPLTTPSRLLLMTIAFAAGVAGAFVVVLVAPARPGVHALILLAIYLVIDVAAAASLWDTQPLWFTLLIVPLVFPQVWLGAAIGLRARTQWRGASPRGAGGKRTERSPAPPHDRGGSKGAQGNRPD